MKYIDRNRVAIPEVLTERGERETAKNIRDFKADPQKYSDTSPDIDSNIYGHQSVKDALDALQKGVCCYCESPYKATSHGDIEHYRPKAGYKQFEGDSLHRPGYFWLAYSWDNLMYACEKCNRSHKKNLFPLEDNTMRCNPRYSLNTENEHPLLVNPYEEEHPERHFTFDGCVEKGITTEGRASVIYLGLDRPELNEERLNVLNGVRALERCYLRHQHDDNANEDLDELRALLNDHINKGRYTLMIKHHFGKYLP